MSKYNLSLFILVVIFALIISMSLIIFTDLSIWLALSLPPIIFFTALTAFSLIIELVGKNKETKTINFYPDKKSSGFTLAKKPEGLSCPSCGSDKIFEIIYEPPAITQEIQKKLEKKTNTLGEGRANEDAPAWVCDLCKCKFHHTINKEQAIKIVKNILKDYSLPENDECILIESETIEKKWGWVFFYTSKKWLETNDFKYALAGNAPFMVLRKNGKVLDTGTAYTIEHYIKHFEETGNPHG